MCETVKRDWEETMNSLHPQLRSMDTVLSCSGVFEHVVVSLSWALRRTSWWLSIGCLKRVRLGMGLQAGGWGSGPGERWGPNQDGGKGGGGWRGILWGPSLGILCLSCSYIWQHIDIGYVQGMCDLLAPLLVILDDGECILPAPDLGMQFPSRYMEERLTWLCDSMEWVSTGAQKAFPVNTSRS